MANTYLILYTDNSAIVSVLNKQTSKEPLVMILVRKLVLLCLTHNIVVEARHVPGADNSTADALSRLQMVRFRELFPRADREAVRTPPLPVALS